MSKTLEKRDDLQLFLKEQIIGPGAFNKRYFLLSKWKENEFTGREINKCVALQNESEIISEVPAYQYSSAILFPISVQEVALGVKSNDEKEDDDDAESDTEDFPSAEAADDEEFDDDKSQSVSSKNQNYPNTCGIAFAVNNEANLSNDLIVECRYRTYEKLSQESCLKNKLAFFVSENKDEIKRVFKNYFSDIFSTDELDGNLFISLLEHVDINSHIYTLDYQNLESFVSKELVPKIELIFPGITLFKRVTKVYDKTEFIFTTLYTDQLYELVSASVKTDSRTYDKFSDITACLEVYNQVKEIVTELKTIYRKSSKRNRPTPVWEAKTVKTKITLERRDHSKKTQRGLISVPGIKNLDLSFQYLTKVDRISGIEIVYVKLILVNRNVVEIGVDEPPQLNKKDDANKKTFFGVNLNVQEAKPSILVAYNPPNLIDIDEEDNLNKLLYRKYRDLGEGYNTSATWGKNGSLNYVATDFLPEQDTPNVDYKPSKVVKGEVVPLVNDNALTFRNLSLFSEKSDDEILIELNQFVSQYGIWIDEKSSELDSLRDIQHKGILHKQLKGCNKDFLRLRRNIKLLREDPVGRTAFRLMNSVMFMQLHHSINTKLVVKNDMAPFVPDVNNEDYYRSLKLDDEYKWRSFQIAFILLNIDAFIRPPSHDKLIQDVFGTGWPERNEIADLIWFPTGGGKTEAYLGLIAFAIAYRRFKYGKAGSGTTVLMRYTLRLLTLQQFQRATLLICALEASRKDHYFLPNGLSLGVERITIGLFVGNDSLPNLWKGQDGMFQEISNIKSQLKEGNLRIRTRLPHTNCPWCGGRLFVEPDLHNIFPNKENEYGIDERLIIVCNTKGCTFYNRRTTDPNKSLPLCLFDEDIYKFPPTLLFGTVDKFAALANKVSTITNERNQDSRRLFGKGKDHNTMPPELIIQDELHLLLGPLGTAVALFEKAVDECCTYFDGSLKIRPKIITSTATTRNTDKQIFALFNRRSEIFPKQGIESDDSFFSFYKREKENPETYTSNRRYVGILPVGKTQVWMQLRVASIFLVHRIIFIKRSLSYDEIFQSSDKYNGFKEAFNYYHTVLSYFNSLKEVGKTQSQLGHYLPGDVNQIYKNTTPWSFVDKLVRGANIASQELTGRLSGEEVKTSMAEIEKSWELLKMDGPPEFVIATNMISVGIDISRFNAMIINSMPRNTAEYIQASSRVARDKEGIVFTVHHPFRSRDISHYQRFKEYHEKFYGYVEPISVTPFANKALERYLAMYMAVIIRHKQEWGLINNSAAIRINEKLVGEIQAHTKNRIREVMENSRKLNIYLQTREDGLSTNIDGIIDAEELHDVEVKIDELLILRWLNRKGTTAPPPDLAYRDDMSVKSLFPPNNRVSLDNNWNVKQSLREIAPVVVVKTVQQ
jgi:hypothetical protein